MQATGPGGVGWTFRGTFRDFPGTLTDYAHTAYALDETLPLTTMLLTNQNTYSRRPME
jgi:hypothetical protein